MLHVRTKTSTYNGFHQPFLHSSHSRELSRVDTSPTKFVPRRTHGRRPQPQTALNSRSSAHSMSSDLFQTTVRGNWPPVAFLAVSNHHRRSMAFPAVSILQLIPSTTHDPRQKHEFIEEGITRRQEWPVSQPATRSSYVSYLFSIIPQMMLATTVPCH
jgi:hypothetical protein